ncbi:MAG: SpoVR-like protein family protein [Candidatus Gottesmanbacteria bacterium GW2011_GWC2_39_8]|uniref:SpoVR-like protein family protein n=1 Tax=Candidatus Gottesmanbacteria bacterium GW2011_GWC2_39_8 TaxID=1618450 RepID=A0A0G0PSP2_9BACT|nr:MAG: SpoVR-like protein family protein [Candidatus Gottesmanbacteria bacterium GW2011_GWC2_39_8]
MKLIDQHAKRIMEQCKVRARAAGLEIKGETLEYIITNQDMIELSPKIMIPTLYDYWVHDVEIIRDKWVYESDPHNPYETVINTRPAISFYNDNNPDWLNTMIFFHVLGHIDFFQSNIFFKNTWSDDFCGQALADKRLLNRIREEMGQDKRWVDYVIEFARGADNLVGYYQELEAAEKDQMRKIFGAFSERLDFYFGEFFNYIRDAGRTESRFYYDEIERYNACLRQFGSERVEEVFFNDCTFRSRFPEFNSVFEKNKQEKKVKSVDILQHLVDHSDFLKKDKNKWMKDVLGVVRKTSLYFQPQIRTKICNEGWASLWHERLFMTDDSINGHRIDYAKVNSGVLVNPRIGFNPYFIGMRLYEFIEELARRGKLSYDFQMIKDLEARKHFDQKMGNDYAKAVLFGVRENFNDHLLVNFLSDEDFQDFVNENNLFVAGFRPSPRRFGFAEIYVKSRLGKEYRKILNKFLYHPPYVVISEDKAKGGELYLDHIFEGRMLVTRYIPSVLMGISFLAGSRVRLETTEFESEEVEGLDIEGFETKRLRVLYTCKGTNIQREVLFTEERGG